MRRSMRWVVLLLVVCLAMTATSCSSGEVKKEAKPEPKPEQKDERNEQFLYVTSTDMGESLDPAVGWGYSVFYWAYDRLVTTKGETTDVQPCLATSWEANADASVWTFHLRKDAKFHDGSPVNAAAVKFTFDRILKIGKVAASLYKPYVDPAKIETPDDHTVVFKLKQSFPSFLQILTAAQGAIQSPKVLDHQTNNDLGQAWAVTRDFGSGAYTVESAKIGEEVRLLRNEQYWGPKGKFKNVVVKIVRETSTQRAMLEKGEVDMLNGRGFDWEILDILAKTSDVKVVERETFEIEYLCFNRTKKPFNDKRVREAVAKAIDYDSLLKGIYLNHAIRLNGPVPAGMMGHDKTIPVVAYNVEQAKKLLAEAGYPNGLEIEFSVGQNSSWPKLAVKLQSDLEKAGIRVKIRQYAWASYWDKMGTGDFQMCICGWHPDYADPSYNVFFLLHSSNAGPNYNYAFYRNPAVDKMIERAATISDQKERAKIYSDIQRTIATDYPYAWLAQLNTATPMRAWIDGYYLNPMNIWYLPLDEMTKKVK